MSKETTHRKDLNKLKKRIEQHLDWGPVTEWHSSMFSDLSDKIFEQCAVRLSPSTLKRFWGVVKFEGQQNISTLDTLSQFIGFENWRAFKLSGTQTKQREIGVSLPNRSLYIITGFFIAVFTIMLISSNFSSAPIKYESIPFASHTVSKSYPNSVVFDFDLKEIKSDNIRIQQFWDVTKTLSLEAEQSQATGIYYFPGYFRAKLMVDDQSVAEHDLFLKSEGWIGTVEYEPVPKYFKPIILEENGISYPKDLYHDIKESSEPLTSVFHYIDDLGNVSGDHFTFQTTIRNTYDEKWAVCQTVRIYFIGSTGAMIIPFSKIGCSSDNSLMLNGTYLNGKKHDLSALGVDLSSFTPIEIQVLNKEVNIFINGNKVYHANYSASMGKLVGMRYKFLGLGEVQSFNLKDQNGRTIPLQ